MLSILRGAGRLAERVAGESFDGFHYRSGSGGLREKIVHAGGQSAHPIRGGVILRDGNDRHAPPRIQLILCGPNTGSRFESADDGHLQVHENCIGLVGLPHFHCLQAVNRQEHLMPPIVERIV